MRCPFCGFEDTKVIDSRPADDRKRRRRECTNCQKRFTTFEVVERPLLMVQKRDGSYEPFDRDKLIGGVFSAIKKRPVPPEVVTALVSEIEAHYANEMKTTAPSEEIGNMVLERLKGVDPIAYVRFASVYKDFSDVEGFIRAIYELDTPDKSN